jgi:hypothetical protein
MMKRHKICWAYFVEKQHVTMKKYLLVICAVIGSLISCESNKENHDQEIILEIGNNLIYRYSDIQLYDSSTHILYFKEYHKEFEDVSQSTFTFMANGNDVYSGSFWPAYLNSMPSGPFISSAPSYYQYYALGILSWINDKPDLRNDPRIIESLKEHGLLHSGLSVQITNPEINNGQLTFFFTVTNIDQSDLLILDPLNTGPNLFHYFTNGLTIRNQSNDIVFSPSIDHAMPSPWNSWKTEWLSQLKSGKSRTYSLSYTITSPIDPGEYKASFVFPGLAYQVANTDLFQDSGRIWLGDVTINKSITIK